MALPIKSNVSWVGKIDWELRKFHGDEYSTHRGSTYNSYLVEEEKIALIDTVWAPFAKEYVANLGKADRSQKDRLRDRQPRGDRPQRRPSRADGAHPR